MRQKRSAAQLLKKSSCSIWIYDYTRPRSFNRGLHTKSILYETTTSQPLTCIAGRCEALLWRNKLTMFAGRLLRGHMSQKIILSHTAQAGFVSVNGTCQSFDQTAPLVAFTRHSLDDYQKKARWCLHIICWEISSALNRLGAMWYLDVAMTILWIVVMFMLTSDKRPSAVAVMGSRITFRSWQFCSPKAFLRALSLDWCLQNLVHSECLDHVL